MIFPQLLTPSPPELILMKLKMNNFFHKNWNKTQWKQQCSKPRRPHPPPKAPKWDNPSYYGAIKSGHFKLLAKCNSLRQENKAKTPALLLVSFRLWRKMFFIFIFSYTKFEGKQDCKAVTDLSLLHILLNFFKRTK